MTTGPIGKLVIAGTIDAVQTWSIGITCEAGSAPTSADLSAWLTAVQPLVTTWWNATNGVKALNKATCLLTQLQAYGYASLGQPASGSAQLAYGTALAGAGTTPQPSQCAIVCTLRTSVPGRHNTGRVYIPMTAAGILGTNRLPSISTTAIATSTAALLTALAGTTINGTTTAAVIVPSSGAGQSFFVTQTSVGDVVDTQRRRRDKYIENRVTHTV